MNKSSWLAVREEGCLQRSLCSFQQQLFQRVPAVKHFQGCFRSHQPSNQRVLTLLDRQTFRTFTLLPLTKTAGRPEAEGVGDKVSKEHMWPLRLGRRSAEPHLLIQPPSPLPPPRPHITTTTNTPQFSLLTRQRLPELFNPGFLLITAYLQGSSAE